MFIATIEIKNILTIVLALSESKTSNDSSYNENIPDI